jgi:hypothetical protein
MATPGTAGAEADPSRATHAPDDGRTGHHDPARPDREAGEPEVGCQPRARGAAHRDAPAALRHRACVPDPPAAGGTHSSPGPGPQIDAAPLTRSEGGARRHPEPRDDVAVDGEAPARAGPGRGRRRRENRREGEKDRGGPGAARGTRAGGGGRRGLAARHHHD